MAAMGPTDRAQFLSRLLGYERLRVAQDLARERRRAITAEATGVKTGMPDADVVRQAAKDAVAQLATADANAKAVQARRVAATAVVVALTPQWEAVQAERERVQRIESDLRVADSEQAARQRELERHDRELADLATAQAELSTLRAAIQPLAALRAELDAMDRLAREEGRRQTLATREGELTAELTQASRASNTARDRAATGGGEHARPQAPSRRARRDRNGPRNGQDGVGPRQAGGGHQDRAAQADAGRIQEAARAAGQRRRERHLPDLCVARSATTIAPCSTRSTSSSRRSPRTAATFAPASSSWRRCRPTSRHWKTRRRKPSRRSPGSRRR